MNNLSQLQSGVRSAFMASFVKIHRRLARTRSGEASLSQDLDCEASHYAAKFRPISVDKPHLSPTLPPLLPLAASACICCQGRCSRFTVGCCQAETIPLLLFPSLRCGHLCFHCCLRDFPGFGLFPQTHVFVSLSSLCSYPNPPCLSLCLSPSSPFPPC